MKIFKVVVGFHLILLLLFSIFSIGLNIFINISRVNNDSISWYPLGETIGPLIVFSILAIISIWGLVKLYKSFTINQKPYNKAFQKDATRT